MLTPTVDNINRMLNLALDDPAARQVLAKDWRVFMTTHFALDPQQRRNLEIGGGIPSDRVEAIQRAVTSVVEYGGAIRLTGGDPALLVVKSKKPEAPNGPDASCTILLFATSRSRANSGLFSPNSIALRSPKPTERGEAGAWSGPGGYARVSS